MSNPSSLWYRTAVWSFSLAAGWPGWLLVAVLVSMSKAGWLQQWKSFWPEPVPREV